MKFLQVKAPAGQTARRAAVDSNISKNSKETAGARTVRHATRNDRMKATKNPGLIENRDFCALELRQISWRQP
ncbi:MAG: hypothetical protein BHW60_05385 [Sutterella sp. 54_7]|nr:MAG: hypothetical protein BHW60_05385 [Sutterella sp. 54_7]